MVEDDSNAALPMDKVIANELEILGSHGMQAYRYPAMLEMIQTGNLVPEKLIQETVNLDEAITKLTSMDSFNGLGMTIIDRFI